MTVIKQKKQRVGVFIDAQNLYHTARNLYGANVNFANILEDALDERVLIRAIAYVITTEGGEESVFFEALEKAGIETKSKDLQVFVGGAKKGDWDVGLSIDAIRLAPKLDAVVLVSGDGDFVPLVEYLKFSAGCQVEVLSFKKSSSLKLLESADHFLDLSENKKRYLIVNKRMQKIKNQKQKENRRQKKEDADKKNNKVNDFAENKKITKIVKGKTNTAIKKRAVNNKKAVNKTTKATKEKTIITRVAKKDIIVDGTINK